MERLKQRADFLAAAAGATAPAKGFVLQARRREDQGPARFGFTVSKKVGNAVERNRVRRRLRDIVRRSVVERVQAGYDYVLIGRRAALTIPFAHLSHEFAGALTRLYARRGSSSRGGKPLASDENRQ